MPALQDMRWGAAHAPAEADIAAGERAGSHVWSAPARHPNKSDTVGFVVVTTDKGLCGGLNTNILRAVTNQLRDLQAQGKKAQAVAFGNKGLGFLNRIGAPMAHQSSLPNP